MGLTDETWLWAGLSVLALQLQVQHYSHWVTGLLSALLWAAVECCCAAEEA